MNIITAEVYADYRRKIDSYNTSMRTLFPKQNGFTPAEIGEILRHAGLTEAPTNEMRSACEVYEFCVTPPERYFLYINREKKVATTWTGDVLGQVYFGTQWRDNFGGTRVPITVRAINGKTYHGTYYKSSGDYARIKLSKRAA
jgi:hypothetical protein